jgi:hypothetical protein
MLLEYRIGTETAVPSTSSSLRLDALDVNNSLAPSTTTASLTSSSDIWSTPVQQQVDDNCIEQGLDPFWGGEETDHQKYPDMECTHDWPWLLEESGQSVYQTGDPTTFWSQLQRI